MGLQKASDPCSALRSEPLGDSFERLLALSEEWHRLGAMARGDCRED
jgi:hypothetical protein